MILFTKRASNIYLIPKSKMKEIILKEMHNSPLARHPGYLKTYKQIRKCFAWKGLKNDVLWMGILYLLKKKSEHTLPTGIMKPLPIPDQKWESISIDFIIGLPKY